MNEPTIPSDAERVLDQAIELTFPASDPIAVESAFLAAHGRERTEAGGEAPRPQTRRQKPKRPRS